VAGGGLKRTLSVKKFINELAEKRKLIDEMTILILNGSSKNLKKFHKIDVDTPEEVVKFFINIGNMSFFSGDYDTFEYFVDSLFKIMYEECDWIDTREVMKYICDYVRVSIHNHNVYSYSIILNKLKEYVYKQVGMEDINHSLRILKDLALNSVSTNFILGFNVLSEIFTDIDSHLKMNDMHVSSLFLKNIIISLIYNAQINHNENIKEKIILETSKILNLKTIKDEFDMTELESTRQIVSEPT
jgi:hypothetical protein